MNDYDPRIVDLYDKDNASVDDHKCYRSLANRVNARSILDVGGGGDRFIIMWSNWH